MSRPIRSENEVEELRQQYAEAEWLLRMSENARDRAERRIEAVESLADKFAATPDRNMSHRNVAQSLRTALARTCDRKPRPLPLHRTEAGYPRCATCDGGGCLDCTDPA